jgi:hypothetical protein
MVGDEIDIPAVVYAVIGVMLGSATLVRLWLERRVTPPLPRKLAAK